jgi:hypothetical protein
VSGVHPDLPGKRRFKPLEVMVLLRSVVT